jgi:hypothetical protein
MRKITMMALLLLSCGTEPFVSRDVDPRHCAHTYPLEESPDFCESNSASDCCTWESVRTDEGQCRYDYCASYTDNNECTWVLQFKSCSEGMF